MDGFLPSPLRPPQLPGRRQHRRRANPQPAAPLQPQLLHLRHPPAGQTGRRESRDHRRAGARAAACRRPVPCRPRRAGTEGAKARAGAGVAAACGDHRVRQLRAVHRQGHPAAGPRRAGHLQIRLLRLLLHARDPLLQNRSLDALCEEQPDVLLVCSSILSTEAVVRAIPFGKLRPDTIVADVLSVKQFPRNLLLEILPPEFGIVCTHPMFGPESGKHGWNMLPFVYDKVRIAEEGDQKAKCEQFLSIFEGEGCRMEEMSCAEHDRHAAGSQFITHTIGRVLALLNLKSTPINTKGYETLLQLTQNTVSDSFDLYYGLFMYNVNATEQMDKLDRAFQMVKEMLYDRLHDIVRKQIVERVPVPGAPSLRPRQL